ncbi:hypothetical protein C2S51_021437 [Perilla frutescens var. frutescens]|nr:hypothetical protein C2S51_021437 [Perilla frutescens var. frutescens]
MKKLKSDRRDRLSELCDSLILKILSFLNMREVIGTILLSKRWKHLWNTIPCLDFDEYGKNSVQTRNFINRALMLWKGSEILKFKIISGNDFDRSLCHDIDLWVRFAGERNVVELDVHFPYGYHILRASGPLYSPPQCLYSYSSIRKLSLVGCSLQIRGNVHWDQLKILTIHAFSVSEDVIEKVVSGAPQLEIFELRLMKLHQTFSIRSTSLKRLSIQKYGGSMEYDRVNYTVPVIWAPNLEAFVISGPPQNCLVIDALSLTDVTLDFHDMWDEVLAEALRQILPTIQHVEVATLSSCCFKMLGVMKDKYSFSPLSNVKLLRCQRGGLTEPNEIVGVLEIFPKLKRLVIDEIRVPYPCCLWNQDIGQPLKSGTDVIKTFLMQLRTAEISWSNGPSVLRFVEFFLKHATLVEKIVIQKRASMKAESEDMFLTAEKLLELQRSYPTVDLILCKKLSSSISRR